MNGFLARHPNLSKERCRIVDTVRLRGLTVNNLTPFYQQIDNLRKLYTFRPELTFNMDETSINFSQRFKSKVIVTQNTQQVLCAQPDRVTSCTLVLGIPAVGEALQSTLIWPQASIPDEFSLFCLKRIRVLCNKRGWQTRESFEDMMLQYYLPEMERRREAIHASSTPILLYLDGHSSRLSITFIRECIRRNIIVTILPAHSSSHTQPLDNGPNGVLKNEFCKLAATKLNQRMIGADFSSDSIDTGLASEGFDEESMPPLPKDFQMNETPVESTISAASQRMLIAESLPAALEYALLSSVIARAWRKTGLQPFDPDMVLKDLPIGPEMKRRSSNYPSISGTILTSTSSVLSVWKWRSEKIAKELQKTNEEALKHKLRDELCDLEVEGGLFRTKLAIEDGGKSSGDVETPSGQGEQIASLQGGGAEALPSQSLPSQTFPSQSLPSQSLPSQSLPSQSFIPPQQPSSTIGASPLIQLPPHHNWTTPKPSLPLSSLISPSANLLVRSQLPKKKQKPIELVIYPSQQERLRRVQGSGFSSDCLPSAGINHTNTETSKQLKTKMKGKPSKVPNPENSAIMPDEINKVSEQRRTQRNRKMNWNPDYIYNSEFYPD